MQIHALGLGDFCEEEYSLIGIHTRHYVKTMKTMPIL
jgi:hypothetical protein